MDFLLSFCGGSSGGSELEPESDMSNKNRSTVEVENYNTVSGPER